MQTFTNAQIIPYLDFAGRCEEALEFYKAALGAKVEIVVRFNESPEPVPAGMLEAGFEKKIMHTTFTIGGATVMASDGCDSKSKFSGFNLSLALPQEADVEKAFVSLSEGGKVTMPLAKTFWSKKFGMLSDKFGVNWMLTVRE